MGGACGVEGRGDERFFQTLAESVPHLVWTCLPDGRCDYLGRQWVAYTGLSEAAQLDYQWLERLHPDDRDSTASAWQRAVEGGVSFDTEFRIRRYDGQYRWFKTRALPERDAAGTIVRWYGTNTDIQELRDTEARLREANKALEAVLHVREQAQQETSAELARELYRRQIMFRVSPVAKLVVDADGRVLDCNEAAASLTGRARPSMIGGPLHALVTPRASHAVDLNRLLATVTTRPDTTCEVLVDRPAARAIPALLSLSTLTEAADPAREYVCVLTDLSVIEASRAERERLARRLALATSAAGCGVWEWDPASGSLAWDDQMFRLYGVDRSAFPGAYEAWSRALHPEDRVRAEREVTAAAEGEVPFDTTFRIIRPDGAVRHIRAHGQIHLDERGNREVLGTNWDVTDEAEMHGALEAQTRLLHDFIKHTPAAIAMLDRDMRYLQASDRWITDYALDGQDIRGRSHYDVFPDIPERWKQVHQRALAGAVERCDEDPFPRHDGRTEWLEWEVRPWRDAQGEIGGVVFFTHVITARKESELLLERRTMELERKNAELQQFAYAASHDLQEPLRAVAGCTQILRSRYGELLDARGHELMTHAIDGTERMRTLITDLLALSRIETEARPSSRVDLREICGEALANLEVALREANAEVILGEMDEVWGDPRQLIQLVQNLVGNAVKYRAPDRTPVIRIDCRALPDAHEVAIADNGIGIEAQYFERIFGVFQRLHTRTKYPGTGIGLAICQRVVQRHEGKLWVESEPGRGSVFRFTLPAPRVRRSTHA